MTEVVGRPTPASDGYPALLDTLLDTLRDHRLVNVTGPLGSGKTWLVNALPRATVIDLAEVPTAAVGDVGASIIEALNNPDPGPLVLDSVDGPSALSVLARLPSHASVGKRPLVIVSRRAILARPGWAASGVHVLTLPAWEDRQIQRLIERLIDTAPATDGHHRHLLTRRAAGNPLVADALCRARHLGIPADADGALADHVTQEIHQRLTREGPAPGWQQALADLATVWSGTLELLQAERDVFQTLAGLSLVQATDLGLTLSEPYRTLIELSHRWRMPKAHQGLRTRALAYRMGQWGFESAPQRRGELAESVIALSQDRSVRDLMFPTTDPQGASIRTASAEDGHAVGALMHGWAREVGLDTHRTGRLLEQWLREDPAGVRVARDGAGRSTGFATVLRVTEQTLESVEPLLQQHVAKLHRPGGKLDGFIVTNVYGQDRATVAALLRHLMRYVLVEGKPVAVTAQTPDYQDLVRSLNFDPHGEIHDIFRSGRRPQVFSHDFGAVPARDWLRQVATASTAPAGVMAVMAEGPQVAQALSCLNDPNALAATDLATRLAPVSGLHLQRQLRRALRALEDSKVAVDAQAGWILRHYYLGVNVTHSQLIRRLDLSRATYFRRYQHGLAVLGQMVTDEEQDLSA